MKPPRREKRKTMRRAMKYYHVLPGATDDEPLAPAISVIVMLYIYIYEIK